MSGIKKQISDLRNATPKRVQWLFLGAAFIVVLILLTMLLGGQKSDQREVVDTPINLIFDPAIDSVNWANTTVGQKQRETIRVSANAPVKIMQVRRHKEIAGLKVPDNTCSRVAQINQTTSCTITLEYQPTAAMNTETTALFIDWRGVDQPDGMKKTDKIVLVVGATAPTPAPTQVTPEPVVAAPVKNNIAQEIQEIAPSDPFANDTTSVVTPVVTQGEACSKYAFPGYDSNGTQIGWVKAERGAYYFHPFSDKNCDSPTGIYNPDSGIITDIKNSGKKIGTDAEHIGYNVANANALPKLSNPVSRVKNRAYQLTSEEIAMLQDTGTTANETAARFRADITMEKKPDDVIIGTSGEAVFSSDPFDRTFVLRQYKPIPATIVSEVRADPSLYTEGAKTLPVRATVDRNVYSDNGRTVVIPAGTLLLGYVTGDIPGPYKTVGRMDIRWYQFVLPSGVEFNFANNEQTPFSGDSQGRVGVPGYGSTDYIEQMVLPLLTAVVPAAVNMIAPITDKFVNQIDLDNNTVVQSGTVRSSELAKNEIINAWNQVAQKFIVDMMDNTVPPFSIAAGTRINVFSPTDLVITCGTDDKKNCSVSKVRAATRLANDDENDKMRNTRADWEKFADRKKADDDSWVGQVRSFNFTDYCITENGVNTIDKSKVDEIYEKGYDYRTVLAYCQSQNYQAINTAKQKALYQNQQEQFQQNNGSVGSQTYNENVLGLKYNDDGAIINPFQSDKTSTTTESVITCEDGTNPDANGCCTGEIYTDMGNQGFNCCPSSGGDCFPPIL